MHPVDPLPPPRSRDTLSEAKRRLLQERIGAARATPRDDDGIGPRAPGAAIPISAEQHRIWLHSAANAEVPLYNEAITIHRRGSFRRDVLNRTFAEILRRHEAWRTSFAFLGDEAVQVVHPPPVIDLPLLDLSDLPEAEREAEALRLAAADAAVPIALDAPLLFRARVVRLAPDYHRIYLTLHHIIFDGVSIYRIFMPELAAIYDALAAGDPIPLPEPVLQYGDYAIWRRRHIASAAVAGQLDYWRRKLAGRLPVLHLPTDRPRSAQLTHRGAMECFQLPAGLIADLRGLSRAHGVTLYMTLLAAFKTLLFRYSGQDDLIVGGVTDARRRVELESLMGYFLDTFALRTAPRAEKSFAAFLHDVRDTVLEALAAVDVPFDQVVQAVQPPRDSSHHPIFQAFFSIEPPVAPFREGWDLTQMDVAVRSAKFDLYLELDERPDHMAARFMYNADLFEPATIQRMAAHWQVLLRAVVRDPAQTLGELPLLTPGELAELTAPGGWNDTATPFPDRTLHELILAEARRSPSAIALVSGETTWTYAELIAHATALAAALSAAGATRGSVVALLLTRSPQLVAGMVATLMTGAAYLPLDPETPRSRIALCLEDAAPVAILTETALGSLVASSTARVLFVDGNQLQPGASSPVVDNASAPADLAYLIHTSGSTGRPKAVEISHAAVVNLLTSMQREPGFGPADILLAVTTVSFDIAALEIFLPLISGGRVVLADRTVALDPYLLAALIDSSGCTVMQATPATWRSLLAIGWQGPRSTTGRRPLRVLCGGEPLPRDLADRLLATGVELWNMYGPTETTIWSTVHRVGPGAGPVSIGRPIANTTAFLLDARRQLVPVGVPGELYLGGAGLARGYRRQPARNAERFLAVAAADNARLYRTGDLAVRRADGALECLGRTDNQVKIRGFRVELEAVEAAVLRHPRVEAAAARVWPDPAGGMRLSVYVVGRDGPPPTLGELRPFLQTDLPDSMIPSDGVAIAAIPLTSNGKVDRSALPPPPVSAALAPDATGTPTALEQRLATIWADLLRTPAVGVHDDFFDLGGHSLLVATLQHRIAAAFGQRLPMAALFHAPTVRQQAALLQAAADEAPSPPGLLRLQPKGHRPSLFWLHPPPEIGHLTAALGDEHPFFGLALTETDIADLRADPDIRAIAARHVAAIRKAQPEGPYFLGGFCTGGIVAFQTAAQLEAEGAEVALLVLVDSQNPVFYKRIDSLMVELSKMRFYLQQKRSQKTLRKRIAARLRKIWDFERATTEMEASEQLTNLAAYRYAPPAYRGDVLLLRPVDRPTRMNHLRGWQAVAANITARDVAGHHEELWEPARIRGVADEIARSMSRTGPASDGAADRARPTDDLDSARPAATADSGRSPAAPAAVAPGRPAAPAPAGEAPVRFTAAHPAPATPGVAPQKA